MMYKFLLTAGTAMFALGVAAPGHADDLKQDLGVNNKQIINKPAGDPSVVQQYAGPGSHDNVQGATTSSPGASANTIIQSTGGGGNVQTAVQSGASGNVVVQTQQGTGNRQTITQTGDGNHAVQSQSGKGHTGTLDQHGGETDIQIQK